VRSGAGDRAPSTTEIEDRRRSFDRRRFEKEELRAAVEAFRRKHAAVRGQRQRHIGQVDLHGEGRRLDVGVVVEVVTVAHRVDGNL
jgi:hypothetical protein